LWAKEESYKVKRIAWMLALALPLPLLGQTAPAANEENEILLAKAATMYYSTSRAGLSRFECGVHPEWQKIYASMSQGQGDKSAEDVALLGGVKITLKARMKGGTGVDWENPKPKTGEKRDAADEELLDRMQSSITGTLQSFMQFWVPFVDGSTFPETGDGLEVIADSKGGFRYKANQGGTEATGIFNPSLMLEEFVIANEGTTVDFHPRYAPTAEGMLISGLTAEIKQPGAAQAQRMEVELSYQKVEKYPAIPAHLKMSFAGRGELEFNFDGCKVDGE